MTGYYLQVIGTLAVFFVGLFVLYRFSKVVQSKKYTGEIKIIDRLPVDTNVTLSIVSIRDKEYLFGLSGKSIQLIDRL